MKAVEEREESIWLGEKGDECVDAADSLYYVEWVRGLVVAGVEVSPLGQCVGKRVTADLEVGELSSHQQQSPSVCYRFTNIRNHARKSRRAKVKVVDLVARLESFLSIDRRCPR